VIQRAWSPLLIFKPLGYLKKRASFYGNSDYYPELWIQDNNHVSVGGHHRWRPLRGKERVDPLTTLIGVTDNPTNNLRKYMVAAVTDDGREIPVASGSYGRVNRGGLTKILDVPWSGVRPMLRIRLPARPSVPT
jgi:hypothetical protein